MCVFYYFPAAKDLYADIWVYTCLGANKRCACLLCTLRWRFTSLHIIMLCFVQRWKFASLCSIRLCFVQRWKFASLCSIMLCFVQRRKFASRCSIMLCFCTRVPFGTDWQARVWDSSTSRLMRPLAESPLPETCEPAVT